MAEAFGGGSSGGGGASDRITYPKPEEKKTLLVPPSKPAAPDFGIFSGTTEKSQPQNAPQEVKAAPEVNRLASVPSPIKRIDIKSSEQPKQQPENIYFVERSIPGMPQSKYKYGGSPITNPVTFAHPEGQNVQAIPTPPKKDVAVNLGMKASDISFNPKGMMSGGTDITGNINPELVKSDTYKGGYLYKTPAVQGIGEYLNIPIPGFPYLSVGNAFRELHKFSDSMEAPLYDVKTSFKELNAPTMFAAGAAAGLAKSPASTARFFTDPIEGIKSLPSLPGQLQRLQYGSSLEAGSIVGETAGNIALSQGVFKGIGKGGTLLKNAYISLGAEKIPLSKITTEGVIRGTEPEPLVRSIREAQSRFAAARTPSGTIKVSHASPKAIGGNEISPGFAGKPSLEDPGLFVTPEGSTSLYFTRIKAMKGASSELTLNPFSGYLKIPAVTTFEVSNVVRYPRSVINEPGFAGLGKYQSEVLAPKGLAVISKRLEIGMGEIPKQKFIAEADVNSPGGLTVKKGELRTEAHTSELEAMLPITTKFAYTPGNNFLARLKGFSKYTEWEGKNIALRDATVQTAGKSMTGKVTLTGEKLAREARATSESLSAPRSATPYPSIASLSASARSATSSISSQTSMSSLSKLSSFASSASATSRASASSGSGISRLASSFSGSSDKSPIRSSPTSGRSGIGSLLSGMSGRSKPPGSEPPSSPPSSPSSTGGSSRFLPPSFPLSPGLKDKPFPFKKAKNQFKKVSLKGSTRPSKFGKVVGLLSEGVSKSLYGKSTLDKSYKGSREIFSPSKQIQGKTNPGKFLSQGGFLNLKKKRMFA